MDQPNLLPQPSRPSPSLDPATFPKPLFTLLQDHPSLLDEIQRLKTVTLPVAGGPAEPTEQGLLIAPDPAERRKPRKPRQRRGR